MSKHRVIVLKVVAGQLSAAEAAKAYGLSTRQVHRLVARYRGGSDVEILNWLDDHSRYLISCTAHTPVTGDTVVMTFVTAIEEHATPASTLTDNGRVYTARRSAR